MELKNYSEPTILPLPKEDYVTISIDFFIDLIKAQSKIELLKDLCLQDKAYLVDDLVKGWIEDQEGVNSGK